MAVLLDRIVKLSWGSQALVYNLAGPSPGPSCTGLLNLVPLLLHVENTEAYFVKYITRKYVLIPMTSLFLVLY